MEVNTFCISGTKRFTAGFINITRQCPYSLTLAMLQTPFASFVNLFFLRVYRDSRSKDVN